MTTYSKTYDEPEGELEEGSMSFLDHLDELRSRLIRIALFVVVAFVVCWFVSDIIYGFLQVPVQAAMLKATKIRSYDQKDVPVTGLGDYVGKPVDFILPGDLRIGESVMPAGANLRCKVQTGADGAAELVTANPVVVNNITVIPEGYVIPRELYAANNMKFNPEGQLVVATVQGAFNLYIKVSFYAAIFFGVPFILVQAWGFIAPGLYPHEKRYAAPIILMATGFFLAGAAFAYYVAFPRAADFLLNIASEGKTHFRPLVTADEYFDLIITIMLGLGIVFEIPTITFFGARLGLISPRMLVKVWRYAVVIIFIIAAVLSPTTDVPNLLVFAAPMLILYFLSIGIAWIFHRKRRTEAEYQALERKDDR
jgi:sec-independent protein translocase protein TatC